MAIQVWNKQTVLSATNSASKFLQINPSLWESADSKEKAKQSQPPNICFFYSSWSQWCVVSTLTLSSSTLSPRPITGTPLAQPIYPEQGWCAHTTRFHGQSFCKGSGAQGKAPSPLSSEYHHLPTSHTPAHPPTWTWSILSKLACPPGGIDLGAQDKACFPPPGIAQEWKETRENYISQCWQGHK